MTQYYAAYYSGAHGVMVVYDRTDAESMCNVDSWITEVIHYARDPVKVLVVGNKSDLNRHIQVSAERELLEVSATKQSLSTRHCA